MERVAAGKSAERTADGVSAATSNLQAKITPELPRRTAYAY
ncbi:MAG: hypothetical protein Q4G33_11160 [bacterium]|nr:hypothetical protein [bacterium]